MEFSESAVNGLKFDRSLKKQKAMQFGQSISRSSRSQYFSISTAYDETRVVKRP